MVILSLTANPWSDFVVYGIAIHQIAYILVKADIFAWLRNWAAKDGAGRFRKGFLKPMLDCPLCTGVQVAFWVVVPEALFFQNAANWVPGVESATWFQAAEFVWLGFIWAMVLSGVAFFIHLAESRHEVWLSYQRMIASRTNKVPQAGQPVEQVDNHQPAAH